MKREQNFEVMRTLAMLLIVAYHCLTHGVGSGYAFSTDYPVELANVVVADTMLVFSSIAVNLYVMVSGYFLVDLDFKLSRLSRTWLNACFYSFAIAAVMMMTGTVPFSVTALGKSLLPLSTDAYWFVTQFVGLLILSPFLAMMVRQLTHRQYVVLLVGGALLCLAIIPDFPLGKRYHVAHGNSVWSFVYLFLVAGYVKHHLKHIAMCRLLSATVVVTLLILGCELYKGKDNGGVHLLWLDYNALPFVLSVLTFVIVRQWQMGSGAFGSLLARMAPYTFGVYLIHDHLMMRQWLWTNIDLSSLYTKWTFLLAIVGVCIAIFLACVIIDMCRQQLFRLLRVDFLMKRLESLVNSYFLAKHL